MKRRDLRDVYFLGFSMGIGVLGALGALVFRTLIAEFQLLFWGPGATFFEQVIHSPPWLRVLVPAAAGLAAGPIIAFLVPEARGPGVPEVIVSVVMRQSTIRHRVTLLKAFVTSLLIGGGASVGREGPVVQIGASIGSSLAQLFRLSPDLRRVCLASGAAAGISATFNAPMAGTLFALEIILMDIEIAHISHILVASISASVLSRLFWGELPLLTAVHFRLFSYHELAIYFLLGILAGLVAIGFIGLVDACDLGFRKLPAPQWLKPGLGGLLLGLLALLYPSVLGVGYEIIREALTGSLVLRLALLTLAAKMAATALCIGSGMSGGIFAPSIVLGSTLGTATAIAASMLFPELEIRPGHYALAGMGAVVAGTTLAPITAIVTLFELTLSYRIILPLMVSCIASALVVKILFGYSAYEMKLLRQGYNIVRGHDVNILRNLHARDFMSRSFECVRSSAPLGRVVEQAVRSPYPHFVVLGDGEELAGVLSLRDLKDVMGNYDALKDLVVAADLMTREVITLSEDDHLEKALHLFEKHHVSFLPVTDPRGPSRVTGILKKDDLLLAYEERVLKDRILSRTA